METNEIMSHKHNKLKHVSDCVHGSEETNAVVLIQGWIVEKSCICGFGCLRIQNIYLAWAG